MQVVGTADDIDEVVEQPGKHKFTFRARSPVNYNKKPQYRQEPNRAQSNSNRVSFSDPIVTAWSQQKPIEARSQFPAQIAIKEDSARWLPPTQDCLFKAISDIKSCEPADFRDIPEGARIYSASFVAKSKLDTTSVEEKFVDTVRMVINDSKDRSPMNPAETYASVARSKTIKLVFGDRCTLWIVSFDGRYY